MNFTTLRYAILFSNSQNHIVHVINHEWNRSMFVASTMCFVWDTKPDFPSVPPLNDLSTSFFFSFFFFFFFWVRNKHIKEREMYSNRGLGLCLMASGHWTRYDMDTCPVITGIGHKLFSLTERHITILLKSHDNF